MVVSSKPIFNLSEREEMPTLVVKSRSRSSEDSLVTAGDSWMKRHFSDITFDVSVSYRGVMLA